MLDNIKNCVKILFEKDNVYYLILEGFSHKTLRAGVPEVSSVKRKKVEKQPFLIIYFYFA